MPISSEKEEYRIALQNYTSAILRFLNSVSGEKLSLSHYLSEFRQQLNGDDIQALLPILHSILSAVEDIKYSPVSAELLQEESDFSNYINLLLQASEENCCIVIAAGDTPCGSPDFTYELGEKLRCLHLNTNLCDKWRNSFCAIIDGSKTVGKKLAAAEAVSLDYQVDHNKIFHVTSRGYGVPGGLPDCTVAVNSNTIWKGTRGISFITYSKSSGKILDTVRFDTYTSPITAYRDKLDERVSAFIKTHPEVTFFDFARPMLPDTTSDQYERFILDQGLVKRLDIIAVSPEVQSRIFPYTSDPHEIATLLTQPALYRDIDGARYYHDFHSSYVNCTNGRRVTGYAPEQFNRIIYVVGACVDAGIGVRDQATYASQLQNLLNKFAPEEKFMVVNCASGVDSLDPIPEFLATLQSLPLQAGDIVIGIGDKLCGYNPEYDVRPCKYGQVFIENYHLAEGGHRLVAESLFNTLKENDFFREGRKLPVKSDKAGPSVNLMPELDIPELNAYCANIENIWKNQLNHSEHVGAIVMNCNPFTLGHRYLIAEAAKQCEYLIVFVVEEDKSFFSFQDRIELVRKGTSDLHNVIVVESGKFIISSVTFEGYFNKQSLQDRVVDSSSDVTLFAKKLHLQLI